MSLEAGTTVDRIVRVHIAARILGCSARTVRRRIENHKIPAERIGRRAWGIRTSVLNRRPHGNGGHDGGD
jgi:excisionase family DNA binding protein